MRVRSVVKNAFVGQRAEVVDVPARRVVDRAGVVERAGESVGNCARAGIVDRAGVGELATEVSSAVDVERAFVVDRARVGDGDGTASRAAIVQIDRAIFVVVQGAGVRKAAGIEDQTQAERAAIIERAGIGKAAWIGSGGHADGALIVECALVQKAEAVSRDRAGINKGGASVVDEAGVIEQRDHGLIGESAGIGEVREGSADRAVVGNLSARIVGEETRAESDRAIVDEVGARIVDESAAAIYDRTAIGELAGVRDRAGAVEQEAINQALARAESETRTRIDIQCVAGGELKAVRIPIGVEFDNAGAVQDAGVGGGRGSAAGPIAAEIPKTIAAILPGGGRSLQGPALRPQLTCPKKHGHRKRREDNESGAQKPEAVTRAGSSNFDCGNLHVFLRWKWVANASQAQGY